MTFTPTIKAYQSDGETLKEQIYPVAAGFVLASMGGALSGYVTLGEVGGIRAPFRLQKGDYVKFYPDAEEGTDPDFVGQVVDAKRNLPDDLHEYELDGPWRLLEKINVSTALELGYNSANSAQDRTALAVKYLMDNPVATASLGLSYTEGELLADGDDNSVKRIRIEPGDSLTEVLQTLAYMASTESQTVVVGVDGAGELYFKAIPDTVVTTVTIGASAIDAEEKASEVTPVNRIGIVGPVMVRGDSAGYRAKKYYTKSGVAVASYSKRKYLKAPAIWTEDDMDYLAAGYFARHGAPSIAVSNLLKVEEAVIQPWDGRLTYNDTARGTLETGYINTVSYEYLWGIKATYELGLHNEQSIGGDYINKQTVSYGSDETQNNYESNYGELPEATDVTIPDTIYPKQSGDSTPAVPPSPGGDVLRRGTIASVTPPGGAKYDPDAGTQDTVYAIAHINNGGVPLDGEDSVRFYWQWVNASGVPQAVTYESGELVTLGDGVEIWQSSRGYTIQGAGILRVACRVVDSDTDPDTVRWDPADITSAPEDCYQVAIVQVGAGSGEGEGTYILGVGWTV